MGMFDLVKDVVNRATSMSQTESDKKDPNLPADSYSFSGQANQIKLGAPLELGYGKFRVYPAHAAIPWRYFASADFDQYLNSIYSIGKGKYDISDIRIGATPVSEYPEVQTQVRQPNQGIGLFHPNVYTAIGVEGWILHAPNDNLYPVQGWTPPAVVTPLGESTTSIEVDIMYPDGLFDDTGGTFSNRTVDWHFSYSLINNENVPYGGWTNSPQYTNTESTKDVVRYSYRVDGLPAGRYAVRAARISNSDNSNNAVREKLQLVGFKGYNSSQTSYAETTVVAINFRASNQLSNDTVNQINMRAQRRLPVWNDSTQQFDPDEVSRNPIDAILDMLYVYGQIPLDQIDMPTFVQMRTDLDNENITFDWRFESSISVKDAVDMVAKTFNARVVIDGTTYTIIRDVAQTENLSMWSPNNIIQGSFKIQTSMGDAINAYDGLLVEYTDPSSWLPATVLCTMPDESGNNPMQVRMVGVTDPTRAFKLGMRMRRAQRYERDIVTFKSDLEAYLPSLNDRIVFAHDLPQWSQFARILELDTMNGNILLDVPVTLEDGEDNYVMIKQKDGTPTDPFIVTAGSNEYNLSYNPSVDLSDVFFDPCYENPFIILYPDSEPYTTLKIIKIKAGKDKTATITCTNYDSRVYLDD